MKLIDKDIIIAEIEKRLNANGSFDEFGDETWFEENCWIAAYRSILSFINTLESKEVDLETAFAASVDHFDEKNNYGRWSESDLRQFAEHFFELGLKARKGE